MNEAIPNIIIIFVFLYFYARFMLWIGREFGKTDEQIKKEKMERRITIGAIVTYILKKLDD